MAGLRWIPVNIIQEVLKQRLVNSFKIYLLLNTNTNGYAHNNNQLVSNLVSWTNWTPKTIRKHLDKLHELKWIGTSKELIYVRSIWWINNSLLVPKTYRAVEFHPDWLISWKGYLAASFLGYLAYVQKVKEIAEIRLASGFNKRDCPYRRAGISASYPVSHKSIEKILGVTTSTAHELKRAAEATELIIIQNAFEEVNIHPELLKKARSYSSEFHRLIKKGGRVYERKPDQVTPLLRYKSGKKSKYRRRDY